MADSAIGKLIPLAIVGAIGYYVYEMFFANPAAAGSSAGGGSAASGAGTNATQNTDLAPLNTDVCSKTGALAPWLALVQKARPYGMDFGPDKQGQLTIDEWCYYGNERCTGICDESGLTADGLFPGQEDRGGPLNWNAFSGHARNHGFSGPGTNLRRRRA